MVGYTLDSRTREKYTRSEEERGKIEGRMTAAEGGRTVVVGLHIGGDAGEVLVWALSGTLVRPGDSILAVHVSRYGDGAAQLYRFLADFQDLARLLRVDLVGRVAKGSSIRKALAKEAKISAAAAVVVGVNAITSFGTVSVAKYLAKKLPQETSVVAVRNGKVFFERETPKQGVRPRPTEPSHGPTTALARSPAENSTPGWPLLGKASSMANCRSPREMTVVQWVMQLPDRSGSSPLSLRSELTSVLGKNSSSCRWFSDAELQTCTDHFSSENLIGRGGSGKVYRGCLPGGDRVAVKVPNSSAEAAAADLVAEVDIVTSLKHPNIVSMVGIGIKDDALVSVYKHFSRGSLEENLHGKKSEPLLTWERRFEIAVAVAGALHHLHNSSPRPVIHRDVKSSNILLSEDFHVELSDFGLALWAPTGSSQAVQNDVVGTFGYLAPEYFMYGRVSKKIDVYAFGVVLLELVTGRKPIGSDRGSLVIWASQVMQEGEPAALLDPALEGLYDEDQLQRVVSAAARCLRRSARLRPPMSEVLRLLKGEEGDVETWEGSAGEEAEEQDEEVYPPSSVASHLGLALLDVDDGESVGSAAASCFQASLEDYLKGRWSRSSSFD
ncbi:protein kinase STUNTED-like [Wolffia australiana]